MLRAICATVALLFGSQTIEAAIANLSDDFQTGQQGWVHGMRSLNPPFTTAGGPGGAADDYLQVFSNGSGGASGRWAVFNPTSPTWTGDYLAAGIDRITADVFNDPNNTGTSNTVNIRLGIATTAFAGFGQFVTDAVTIAPRQWLDPRQLVACARRLDRFNGWHGQCHECLDERRRVAVHRQHVTGLGRKSWNGGGYNRLGQRDRSLGRSRAIQYVVAGRRVAGLHRTSPPERGLTRRHRQDCNQDRSRSRLMRR